MVLIALPAAASAQQETVGVYGLWGAFRSGERCQALAEPVGPGAHGSGAFASVGFWRGRGGGGQPYFRLSRPKRSASAVLLRIGERTFQLKGAGIHAWPADRAADAAVVASMRTALTLAVESRSETGAVIRDSYPLRGAATAIDAAAIACSRRSG